MRQRKLEHHPGRSIRVVPIFAEIGPHLERRGVSEKAINAWIGNTTRLRSKHYHAVRAEDWAAVTGVAGNPAPIPAPSAAVTGHQEPSTLHEAREKTLDVQKTLENQYPRQGSNL